MNNGPRKTIVIADDHPLLLRGLYDMLLPSSEFQVVSTAADGEAALRELKAKNPDMAVLDVDMPVLNGVEVLRQVISHRLRTRVILLTASISDAQIFVAIGLGVHGVLLKDSAPDSLLKCLTVVAAGRRWLPPEVIEPALARENERRAAGRKLVSELSAREIEIMRIVAEGQPNKVIARHLGLTEGTVKVHLHNIYQKLGIANRAALANVASTHSDLLQRNDNRP